MKDKGIRTPIGLLGAALLTLAAAPTFAGDWFVLPPEQPDAASISLVLYPQQSASGDLLRFAASKPENQWLMLPDLLRGARENSGNIDSLPSGLRLGFVVSHDQMDGTPGSPVLVADCADDALLRALGLSSTCAALAAAPNANRATSHRWSQGELGAGWKLGDSDMSIVAGAGFRLPSMIGNWSGSRSDQVAPWLAGELSPYQRDNSQWLGVNSRFQITPESNWSVGLNLQRSELGPVSQLAELSSATLGIGVVYGALSGGVATRIQSLDLRNNQEPMQFGTMDLGFSWRTPWSARISIGAQNIFSTAPSGPAAASNDPLLESARARTPYVRYHQDL